MITKLIYASSLYVVAGESLLRSKSATEQINELSDKLSAVFENSKIKGLKELELPSAVELERKLEDTRKEWQQQRATRDAKRPETSLFNKSVKPLAARRLSTQSVTHDALASFSGKVVQSLPSIPGVSEVVRLARDLAQDSTVRFTTEFGDGFFTRMGFNEKEMNGFDAAIVSHAQTLANSTIDQMRNLAGSLGVMSSLFSGGSHLPLSIDSLEFNSILNGLVLSPNSEELWDRLIISSQNLLNEMTTMDKFWLLPTESVGTLVGETRDSLSSVLETLSSGALTSEDFAFVTNSLESIRNNIASLDGITLIPKFFYEGVSTPFVGEDELSSLGFLLTVSELNDALPLGNLNSLIDLSIFDRFVDNALFKKDDFQLSQLFLDTGKINEAMDTLSRTFQDALRVADGSSLYDSWNELFEAYPSLTSLSFPEMVENQLRDPNNIFTLAKGLTVVGSENLTYDVLNSLTSFGNVKRLLGGEAISNSSAPRMLREVSAKTRKSVESLPSLKTKKQPTRQLTAEEAEKEELLPESPEILLYFLLDIVEESLVAIKDKYLEAPGCEILKSVTETGIQENPTAENLVRAAAILGNPAVLVMESKIDPAIVDILSTSSFQSPQEIAALTTDTNAKICLEASQEIDAGLQRLDGLVENLILTFHKLAAQNVVPIE